MSPASSGRRRSARISPRRWLRPRRAHPSRSHTRPIGSGGAMPDAAPAPADAPPSSTTVAGVGPSGPGRGCRAGPTRPRGARPGAAPRAPRGARRGRRRSGRRRPRSWPAPRCRPTAHVAGGRLAVCRRCRSTSRPTSAVAARPRGLDLAGRGHARQRGADGALGDAEERAGAHEQRRRQPGRVGAEQDGGEHGPGGEREHYEMATCCSRECKVAGMVSVLDARPTMLPPEELLTDVLPTDRLTATGMPVPELRVELRRIDDLRNAGTVVATWAPGARHDRPGRVDRAPARLRRRVRPHGPGVRPLRDPRPRGRPQAALHQQAVERLGRPLAGGLPVVRAARRATGAATSPTTRTSSVPASPTSTSTTAIRSPRRASVARCGATRGAPPGGRTSRACCAAFRSKDARPIALRIGVMQLPLIAAAIAIGRWWLYPLLWLGPWMTSWRVINRLRSIAEHGGHDPLEGPAPDHPPRAAVVARPVLDGAAQHGLAPRPPRRHGRAVAQPARSCTPSSRRPATSPRSSPTRATAPAVARPPLAGPSRARRRAATARPPRGRPGGSVPGSRTQA